MATPFKLSMTSAALIYLILLSGVVAIIIAWKMLPKEANSIHVRLLNQSDIQTYHSKLPNYRLRYSIDDTCIRIYADGTIHIHPLANVVAIDVQ